MNNKNIVTNNVIGKIETQVNQGVSAMKAKKSFVIIIYLY